MNAVLEWIIITVNLPGFKFISFSLSAISLFISIWVFRRTRAVLNAQERSILSDQIQYANQQYQNVFELILNNDRMLALSTEFFGFSSPEECQKAYCLYMWINPIYFQYEAVRLGIMDDTFFKLDLNAFARTFRGDTQELMTVLKRGEYPEAFLDILGTTVAMEEESRISIPLGRSH